MAFMFAFTPTTIFRLMYTSSKEGAINLEGEDGDPEWVTVMGMNEREAMKALEIVE
jgi:hypothetical protein